MSNKELNIILAYILDKTGITLPVSNLNPVKHFLAQRWNEKGWDAGSYISEIEQNNQEYELFLNKITINETYFFREERHFHFIKDEILPLCRKIEKPFNIWSASCSTGEEAISIYSLLLSQFDQKDFRVFASDINIHVLDKFKKGEFRTSSLRKDGQVFHNLLIPLKDNPSANKTFSIKKEYINNLNINQINLYSEEIESLPLMNLIFLRNTLIYMNSNNKQKIINKLVKRIKSGGILLLSSSENPLISHPALKVKKSNYCYYFEKIDPVTLSSGMLSKQIRQTPQVKKSSVYPVNRQKKTYIEVKESRTITPGVQEVCRQISLKLNNELYKGEDNPAWKSAKILLSLMYLMESSSIEEAEKLMSTFRKEQHPECLFYFYSGFIPLQKGEKEKACSYFKMALKANSTFWPARYYMISACDKTDTEQKKRNLTRILVDINKYIDDNRFDYQFLLEGFNARYFQMICQNMIQKTGKRSIDSGYR